MAPINLLGNKCGLKREQVVVPREKFLEAISARTGFTEQELDTKTLGQIEERLDLRAVKPMQLSSLKRGKSNSDLYEFVGYEMRREIEQPL